MKDKKLIVANWKMNPLTWNEANGLFEAVKKKAKQLKRAVPILCVPSLYLNCLNENYKGKKIFLGGQDISQYEKTGSHTGEVSVQMQQAAGAQYMIVGHSERRAMGETDDIVRKKLQISLEAGLNTILCIGERNRDREGAYLGFVAKQITAALYGAPKEVAEKLIIAYEPVWAIGKKAEDAMTPHLMHQMSLFIRKVLHDFFDEEDVKKIPVIYGGSVERGNAEILIKEANVEGFLIGHASLEGDHFCDI